MAFKILLADDSPHAQRMGSEILNALGYEVTAVSNGPAALKKLAEFTPDLVIADTSMPGLTGFEVCERMRASDNWKNIPVLLALAAYELYDAKQGEECGANGVVQKPFIPTNLEEAVRKLLDREPAVAPAQTQAGVTEAAPPEPVPETSPSGHEPAAAPQASAPAGNAATDARPRWQVEEIETSPEERRAQIAPPATSSSLPPASGGAAAAPKPAPAAETWPALNTGAPLGEADLLLARALGRSEDAGNEPAGEEAQPAPAQQPAQEPEFASSAAAPGNEPAGGRATAPVAEFSIAESERAVAEEPAPTPSTAASEPSQQPMEACVADQDAYEVSGDDLSPDALQEMGVAIPPVAEPAAEPMAAAVPEAGSDELFGVFGEDQPSESLLADPLQGIDLEVPGAAPDAPASEAAKEADAALLDALAAAAPAPAPPPAAKPDIGKVTEVVRGVLSHYLSPMIAEEVMVEIERRLRALLQ